nr:unnamed protein product [Spirometra erinaceieuropaei]
MRRQHQDWFDGNDAAIGNLLTEKNMLHRVCLDRLTDASKVASCRCRRLAQQWLRKIQDAWMARKAAEIRGYNERN